MIAPWLVYTTLFGAWLCVTGTLGERIMRMRGQSARAFWVTAIVLMFVPPIVINLTPWLPAASAPDRSVTHATSPLAPQAAIVLPASSDKLVLTLWGLASLLVIARIIGTAMVLRRRSKRWVRAELAGRTVLLADDLGPALIGWRRFTTVIPRWALTFDEESRALMLEHEAEHARSGDPYLRSVALVALVLMPWNPALWWAMRRLRLAVEMDCDQRLLRRGIDPHKYATVLLAVGARMSATPFAWATALGGSTSSLEKRIIAMLSPFRPRHPRLVIAALNAGVFVIAIIACASPVPDPLIPPAATVAKVATVTHDSLAPLSVVVCDATGSDCAKGPGGHVAYRVAPGMNVCNADPGCEKSADSARRVAEHRPYLLKDDHSSIGPVSVETPAGRPAPGSVTVSVNGRKMTMKIVPDSLHRRP